MPTALTKQIADAIVARLTATFNSNMATIAAAYGVPAETASFTLGNSQFFRGLFTMDDLEENVPTLAYPIVMLYGRGASNLRETKPAKFAGAIEMGLDIIHAWPVEEVGITEDYETILDATLDVMVEVFNSGTPAWPMSISYPGKLDEIERGPRELSTREQEFTRRQRFVLGFYARK